MPPNIIYMHSHDTGRYISPYGHAARTPNLQRFAEQATLFRHAFTVNPTCSPSRAALVTGMYPHCNGMLGLAHRGFALHDYNQHIVNTLKPHGYHTALAGIQHVARPDASVIGYDRVLCDKGDADVVSRAAADFLHEAARDRPDEPFFLSVGFFETHRPFPEPAPADDPRHTNPPAPLPDMPEVRRDMAGYNTMAHELDDGMGRVLAALDAAGLGENTFVIITTDHGIAFPHMKCNLTDHGIGVMLMIRGPRDSAFNTGRVIEPMVTHLDLFPTICDVVGIDHPDWLQGESLLPLVRGEVGTLHEAVFAEVNFHAAYEPKRAVRTERYKYIRRFDGRTRPVRPNCDDGYSKRLLLQHCWSDDPLVEEYLFDLVFDPNETNNLVARPEMATVLEEMRDRLDRWMRDTNDPLLDGPLMIPAGARLNPPDGQEPGNAEAELVEVARRAP
ncbi:MAG: sulfatase [Phycisphaeraceae bacterium]